MVIMINSPFLHSETINMIHPPKKNGPTIR